MVLLEQFLVVLYDICNHLTFRGVVCGQLYSTGFAGLQQIANCVFVEMGALGVLVTPTPLERLADIYACSFP